MTARHRVQSLNDNAGGTAQRWFNCGSVFSTTQTNTGVFRYSATCDDITGSSGADHALVIEKFNFDRIPMTGTQMDSLHPGCKLREYVNYYPSGCWINPGHLPTTLESTVSCSTRLLARTNPNRYDVALPVFIYELKDLPEMLRLAGNSILKKGAGQYLSWEFGWKPLIADLKRMLDFTGRVNKRITELHKLHSRGGLRRSMSLSQDTQESASTSTIESNLGVVISGRTTKFTKAERWGSVRWLPTALPPKDESEYRRLALRAVYGLELSASNLWEAIPWSWLVDWFTDVGDFLVQYNNMIPVIPSTPCIMTRIETKVTIEPTNLPSWLTGGSLIGTRSSKKRELVGAGLTAALPFLTERQLSILGALFITKHRAR